MNTGRIPRVRAYHDASHTERRHPETGLPSVWTMDTTKVARPLTRDDLLAARDEWLHRPSRRAYWAALFGEYLSFARNCLRAAWDRWRDPRPLKRKW